ncbi:DNA/RNA non-specific endonuclease [Streptococcus gallinaceus]|uniref:Type VII secretion system protein EssD-like domain-containing protein n=1 Tax=Streptococcus gallinaceus TaxID=165758 RepID=A0ABV2JMJ7_9STRE|nr:DNA/RNA non-specific endonuclease [Streptococcus gallinaceus]MCP1639919.1 hypothetical protein [Streptococcus gallinaceus]MCP1770709.1 hypothetical protein [Streptococcus gallinaceus]
MNRGHLIGYQFSGLNDELRNLTPLTAWVNSGNYSGMDSGNMPANTNWDNVITMSEQEALNLGKRHTSKE